MANIDNDDVALFREKFITNPQVIKNVNTDSVDKLLNLFRLSEEEALIAVANISGQYVVSLSNGYVLRMSWEKLNNFLLINKASIKSIIIPYVVNHLEFLDLSGCTNLTSLIFPKGISFIKSLLLSGCSSLVSLIFPVGLSCLDYLNLSGCSNLISLIFSNGVPHIGSLNLVECSSLISLTFPTGTFNIESLNLLGCSGLTSLTFPDGLSYVESLNLSGCSGLGPLLLPKNVPIQYLISSKYNSMYSLMKLVVNIL